MIGDEGAVLAQRVEAADDGVDPVVGGAVQRAYPDRVVRAALALEGPHRTTFIGVTAALRKQVERRAGGRDRTDDLPLTGRDVKSWKILRKIRSSPSQATPPSSRPFRPRQSSVRFLGGWC